MTTTLNIVQTVVLIVAALVSAYAVYATEENRKQTAQRARVERVHAAMLQLAEVAVNIREGMPGQSAAREVARMRLLAELQIVGFNGFESTELMTRPTFTPEEIASQSGSAMLELAERFDELTPRPLWHRLLPSP